MLPGERHFIRPLKQNASVVIRDQSKGLDQVLTLLGSVGSDDV